MTQIKPYAGHIHLQKEVAALERRCGTRHNERLTLGPPISLALPHCKTQAHECFVSSESKSNPSQDEPHPSRPGSDPGCDGDDGLTPHTTRFGSQCRDTEYESRQLDQAPSGHIQAPFPVIRRYDHLSRNPSRGPRQRSRLHTWSCDLKTMLHSLTLLIPSLKVVQGPWFQKALKTCFKRRRNTTGLFDGFSRPLKALSLNHTGRIRGTCDPPTRLKTFEVESGRQDPKKFLDPLPSRHL